MSNRLGVLRSTKALEGQSHQFDKPIVVAASVNGHAMATVIVATQLPVTGPSKFRDIGHIIE